jgi:hypothetical protein
MGAPLAAHGADGGGTWIEGPVGLGQRLLAVTPEDNFERQPLRSADGRFALVCDARLDNRSELAEALALKAADTRDMPDSALIMAAFERWGRAALSRLVGPAAMALWDGRERRLLLASTPLGERPLLYHVAPRFVAFATRPKGLFAAPGVPRAVDLDFPADFLARALSDPVGTFYQGLRRVEMGQALIVDHRGARQERFWQPDVEHELRLKGDEDYVEALDAVFARAVAAQLRSTTPVGVMMSGGFDSTSVAALAAEMRRRQGRRLPTFTEVPRPGFDGPLIPGRYADETPLVAAMARRYPNLDPNLVRTDGRCYIEGLAAYFDWAEVPFPNASNRVWMEAIFEGARDAGVRTLLLGSLGNLTISYDGERLLTHLLRRGQWARAWREARARAWRRCCPSRGTPSCAPGGTALRGHVRRCGLNSPASSESRPEPPSAATASPGGPTSTRAPRAPASWQWRPSLTISASGRALVSASTCATRRPMCAFSTSACRCPRSNTNAGVSAAGWCAAPWPGGCRPRSWTTLAVARRPPTGSSDWPARSLRCSRPWPRPSAATRRAVLDLPRLRRLIEALPTARLDAREQMATYRGVLEVGLPTALFLRWFEAGGAPP